LKRSGIFGGYTYAEPGVWNHAGVESSGLVEIYLLFGCCSTVASLHFAGFHRSLMVPPLAGTVVEEDPNGTWWQAERIVADRVRDGIEEYRVRWVGCTGRQDTWVREEDLADSLYNEYAEQCKAQSEKASKKRRNETNKQTKKGPPKKKPKVVDRPIPTIRHAWTVPDGNRALLTFGTLSIDALCNRKNNEVSFASYYFGKRLKAVEVPLKRGSAAPQPVVNFGGYTFNLLSSRIPEENRNKDHFQGDQKCIRFFYVATSGPGLEVLDLEAELRSIANFEDLPSPHKAKSRLELLQSATTEDLITNLSLTKFKVVKENFHLGCGFIPTTMLEAIGYEPDICIQVRVISPKLGIFKGVLCPKLGIKHIELPTSMRKVQRSKVRSPKEWVVLIVKRTFPSKNNIQLGRQLLGSSSASKPALSSFKRNRGPGEMFERLWRSMGVSQSSIQSYVKRCNKRASIAGLKHTYLLGVKDPFDKLPKGKIFIPGIGSAISGNSVFVTRSPCIEPSDGRLIPVTKKKPSGMSANDWEWLNSLPFGIVIFASPKDDKKPLPELIAGGDLDGDTYLVCWDYTILSSMKMTPTPIPESKKCKLVENPSSPTVAGNWLSAAQNVMLDVEWSFNVKLLRGKLYGEAKRAADKNESQFLKDKDAVQFAQAYNLSLDLGKHGGLLCVPEKVRSKIPKTLHSMLSSPTA
jgi:hypothetical protein